MKHFRLPSISELLLLLLDPLIYFFLKLSQLQLSPENFIFFLFKGRLCFLQTILQTLLFHLTRQEVRWQGMLSGVLQTSRRLLCFSSSWMDLLPSPSWSSKSLISSARFLFSLLTRSPCSLTSSQAALRRHSSKL